MHGFILVVVGLSLAGTLTILFGVVFNWWIDKQTDMFFPTVVELREYLLDMERSNYERLQDMSETKMGEMR